jgi:hypothetical protein
LVASEQDLEQRKDTLGSRRIRRHSSRLVSGPDFRGMAFQASQNSYSEVAHIAVINGQAISNSGVSGQVALKSRHEVRPLPNGLISTSRARYQWYHGNVFYSDLRLV